jgi:hypothetical protein
METWTTYGTQTVIAATIIGKLDNDNWRLMAEGRTPAEFMQWLKRKREELRRELAADFSLRNCPTHLRHWETLDAMEKCCLWHYYGQRE